MIGLNATLRTDRAALIKADLDKGGAAATKKLYTGDRPATGAAITDQVLLGTLTYAYPCGTVEDGVLTFSVLTGDAAADATGTLAWFRDLDSAGTFVMDGTVTLVGDGGDATINTLDIVAGTEITPVSVSTITEGNA